MGKKKDVSTRKIILLGDSYTGKSTILKNIRNSEHYVTEQISVNKFEIKACMYNKDIRLIVWDGVVSGYKTDYRSIAYKNTDLIIICYSIDSNESLHNIEHKWIPELTKYCPDVPYLLVANKTDLRQNTDTSKELLKSPDEGFITKDKGICIAQRIGSRNFLECSAVLKKGLDELVKLAVDTIMHENKRQRKECIIL